MELKLHLIELLLNRIATGTNCFYRIYIEQFEKTLIETGL